jgi:hypothetical protein
MQFLITSLHQHLIQTVSLNASTLIVLHAAGVKAVR